MGKRALFLIFLLSCLTLSASTLNVGIIANGQSLASVAENSLTLVLSTVGENELLESLNYERDVNEAGRSRLSAIHSALSSEAEIPEETELVRTAYYNSNPSFQLSQLSADESFVRARDEEMLAHTARLNSLDLLFVFLYTREQSVNEVEAYVYTSGGVEELGYTLYLDEETRALEGFILSSLLSYLDESFTVLDLSAFPSSRFYTIDGDELLTDSSFAVVPINLAGLTVRRNGFYDLNLTLSLSEGVNTLSGQQVEREVGSITLTAYPYGAEATFFGLSVPNLPLSTRFQSGTVLLSLYEEGFARENIQLTDRTDFYHVQLRPQWMQTEGRVEEAKKDMYSSMRNTLLAFGLYVALGTYASIYSEASSWSQPLQGLAMGISVMGLVSFIRDAIAYYDTAKQVY